MKWQSWWQQSGHVWPANTLQDVVSHELKIVIQAPNIFHAECDPMMYVLFPHVNEGHRTGSCRCDFLLIHRSQKEHLCCRSSRVLMLHLRQCLQRLHRPRRIHRNVVVRLVLFSSINVTLNLYERISSVDPRKDLRESTGPPESCHLLSPRYLVSVSRNTRTL